MQCLVIRKYNLSHYVNTNEIGGGESEFTIVTNIIAFCIHIQEPVFLLTLECSDLSWNSACVYCCSSVVSIGLSTSGRSELSESSRMWSSHGQLSRDRGTHGEMKWSLLYVTMEDHLYQMISRLTFFLVYLCFSCIFASLEPNVEPPVKQLYSSCRKRLALRILSG